MAVLAGVEAAVKLHLQRGDDVNGRDGMGRTPLMLAASRDKAAICKILLDADADPSLVDHLGRDAMSLALENSAAAAVTLLAQAARVAIPPPPPAKLPPEEQPPIEAAPENGVWDDESGASEAGAFAWTAEDDVQAPAEEASASAAAQVALVTQASIGEFRFLDAAQDWEGASAGLPAFASSTRRSIDPFRESRIRQLLLLAIREGRQPRLELCDILGGPPDEPEQDVIAATMILIQDAGAKPELDLEFQASRAEAWLDTDVEATPDEVELLDEAVATYEDRILERNAPTRLFQKSYQRHGLIDAQEEIAIAKEMDAGIDRAVRALAAWPHGVAELCRITALAVANGRLSKAVTNREEEALANPGDEKDAAILGADGGALVDEDNAVDDSHAVERLLGHLIAVRAMPAADSREADEWPPLLAALQKLRVQPMLLFELEADARADGGRSCAEFLSAADDFKRARERLVVANLGLVRTLAKKMLWSGMPLEDLIQDGNVGLLKAVDKFNWRKGFRFSTYATWWIRQSVSRAVADDSRLIRVPVHANETIGRMEMARRAHIERFGIEPLLETLALAAEIPLRKAEIFARSMRAPLSLDDPDDDERELIERSIDGLADPIAKAESAELADVMARLLAELGKNSDRVLRMRFGMGGPSMTLEEVGQCYGVTRERIRQIESKTLRRLKHTARCAPLLPWAIDQCGIKAKEATAATPESIDDLDDASAGETQPLTSFETPALDAMTRASTKETVEKLIRYAESIQVPVDDLRDSTGEVWFRVESNDKGLVRHLVKSLILAGSTMTPRGYRL